MQTAGSDVFRKRDVVVVDEAHGLAEWAEMYATIDLNPRTVPVWDDLRVPAVADADDPLERTVRFADALVGVCEHAKDDLLAKNELSPDEAGRRDRLQELVSELKWFVDDARDPQSPTTWVVDQPDGAGTALSIKPLDPARYLKHTVWDRGNRFALLSATILNKEAFCRGVGLNPARVALVDVPHTFPLEHRPLYDVTQGKMTYDHRDETVPKIARLLVRLMAEHPDQKGLVHCHSYSIQERLHERLAGMGVGARVRAHERDDRNDVLDAWKASPEPTLFLSVKMEEALDLKGDLCRWQVLCKAPYLNTSDSRVARRLEDGQWAWYHRAALRTVIQACGRVVRAPDDHGATYLADSSLLDLFDRARSDLPPWFREQVDAMGSPALPDFDPAAALAGVDATPAPGRVEHSSRSASTSATSTTDASGSSAPARESRSSPSTSASSTGGDRDDRHPLSDVWGE
jgi:Rad3-related DNA helicase